MDKPIYQHFSTEDNSNVLAFISLQKRNFKALPSSGTEQLFVDNVNKTYWFCSNTDLQKNIETIKEIHQANILN